MNYKFDQAHVLVVGDVILDRYLHGQVSRVSTEAPVPVCKVEFCDERPGGAANVAANISSLGGKCTLLGIIGQDPEGQRLKHLLIEQKVSCDLHSSNDLKTMVKLRALSQHQQLIRLDYENLYHEFPQKQLIQRFQQLIAQVDVVVLSDYGKGTLQNPQDYIQIARHHQKPIFIDPVGQNYQAYRSATMIIPNRKEVDQVIASEITQSNLDDQAEQLIKRLKLQALLITEGSKGMTLANYQQGRLTVHNISACSQAITDITGVSDTVIALISLAYASGYELFVAAQLANAAAGVVVTKLGTATVDIAELQQAMRRQEGLSREVKRGIVSETELELAIQNTKTRGQTVVMTNGCFDLLHAGHVTFLQAAKQLGDRLIVAVNTDESVQRHKGPSRPIMKLAERLEMLANLQAVDWVIAFDDDTPERLLHVLKPSFLVKGGDYTADQIVGAAIVSEYGGEVKIIPHSYTEIHTTEVIQRLTESQQNDG